MRSPRSIDNAMTASTVTAFNLRGTSFLPYETHLPAIKTHAQTPARFSWAHENKRRPRDAGAPTPTQAETPASKTRGKALPTPYASVMFFYCRSSAKIGLGESSRTVSSIDRVSDS